jgi:hypothetical protein
MGVVIHAYNLIYSGGRNRENHSSRPTQAKCYQDPISVKLGMMAHTCNSSYTGGIVGESWSEASPGQGLEIPAEK